ncbi:hypothetical protein CHELA20_40329 [Hyphomicrobiales bacterium]|nr:hypothetical protein CHELA20_40329 [Hyphomicrobiales bacterium]
MSAIRPRPFRVYIKSVNHDSQNRSTFLKKAANCMVFHVLASLNKMWLRDPPDLQLGSGETPCA